MSIQSPKGDRLRDEGVTLGVLLVCTGVGTLNRGIESFARECFDGLKSQSGLNIALLKGIGPEAYRERALWNLPRTSRAAELLGMALRRSPYVAEQLSSLAPLIWEIRRKRPQIIFSSEANLFYQLHRWRDLIGVRYRLLFSNGAPGRPPFDRTDYVHQVNPVYYQQAIQAGEPAIYQKMGSLRNPHSWTARNAYRWRNALTSGDDSNCLRTARSS